MAHNYTAPSRLARAGYRLVYDPLRAGYLRRLVTSLGLTGTEHVLDFGSGAGSEAVYLARALDRGGLLTCLDVSPAWLAEARRRLRHRTNVQFLLGEAPSLALPDAEFDLILAHFVLHDVDRAALPATLAALARSLRADGGSSWSSRTRSRGRGGNLPALGSRRAEPAGVAATMATAMRLASRSQKTRAGEPRLGR